MEQPDLDPPLGLKVTLLAPPHWVFWMMEPPELQECVSVQVEPSSMPYSQSMSVSSLELTCIVSMDMESSPLHVMLGWSSRLAEMHLSWKARFVRRSRLPAELEQEKPEKPLLPYELKEPSLRPLQL